MASCSYSHEVSSSCFFLIPFLGPAQCCIIRSSSCLGCQKISTDVQVWYTCQLTQSCASQERRQRLWLAMSRKGLSLTKRRLKDRKPMMHPGHPPI